MSIVSKDDTRASRLQRILAYLILAPLLFTTATLALASLPRGEALHFGEMLGAGVIAWTCGQWLSLVLMYRATMQTRAAL